MPATSAELLFEETACFGCVGPMDTAQRLRIGLELRSLIALDPDADVTPQGLADWATCYSCIDGVSQADAIELAILDQISQAL